ERLARFATGARIEQAALEIQALDLARNRTRDIEIEAAHHAVVTLSQWSLIVVTEPQAERQARRNLPVILHEPSVVITPVRRVYVVSDLAAVWIAEEKRREFVARESIRAQRVGLREGFAEVVLAADYAQAHLSIIDAA